MMFHKSYFFNINQKILDEVNANNLKINQNEEIINYEHKKGILHSFMGYNSKPFFTKTINKSINNLGFVDDENLFVLYSDGTNESININNLK